MPLQKACHYGRWLVVSRATRYRHESRHGRSDEALCFCNACQGEVILPLQTCIAHEKRGVCMIDVPSGPDSGGVGRAHDQAHCQTSDDRDLLIQDEDFADANLDNDDCEAFNYRRRTIVRGNAAEDGSSTDIVPLRTVGFHALFAGSGLAFDRIAVMSALIQQHAHGLPNAAVTTALMIARSNNAQSPEPVTIPSSYEQAIWYVIFY